MRFYLKLICLTFFFTSLLGHSQAYYKDIKNRKFPAALAEEGEIGYLLYLGYGSKSQSQRLDLINQAYKLTKEKKDSTLLPYIYFNYADLYINASQDDKSLIYLLKTKELISWNSHNYLLSRVYSYIGYIYQKNKENDKALINYQIILNNTKYPFSINLANSNIVGIHIDAKKYDVAKPFIDAIFKYYKNNTKKGLNNNSLAFEYQYLSYYTNDLKEKIKLIDKGVELAFSRPKHNTVSALIFRGKFNEKLQKYNLAISDFNTALKIAKENNFIYQIIECYHYLASISLAQNNAIKSLTFIDSSNVYISPKEFEYKRIVDSLSYSAYVKLKNYKKAYFHTKRYIKHLDSIIEYNKDSLYIAFGKKHQTDKKIQENELLKKDNVIKDLEVKKQTTNRNYLLLFSALGLIALGVTYNRFRLKRKTANTLASQNAIINNQKVELEKSNANKQRLFGIIAHDLVNPFNAILGYTKLLEEDYDSFKEEDRKQFISTINKYATNNYNLTKTLLDWAKIQQDRLVVNKATLSCKEIVEMAIRPYQVLADKKQIQITTNIPENTFVEADKNMMQTVIGNLFVNAIKFTPKNGEIKFHLEKNKDGTINIEIEDNGIGMTQEQLNNLFDITKVNTTQGTSNEKGNGLGLILSKELMELQQGTLQLFSKKDIGSRAVLTI